MSGLETLIKLAVRRADAAVAAWQRLNAQYDDAKHKLFVKVVNATSTAQPLTIALTGVAKLAPQATLTTMSGKTPNATNSITHPDAVAPVARKVPVTGPKFTETFAPYSVNVLELSYE